MAAALPQPVVVGSGLGGLAAAVALHEFGADPVVLEKDRFFGGATAASGGQVWVDANRRMAERGLVDSTGDALAYATELARRGGGDVFDPEIAAEWVSAAPDVADFYEDLGVVAWEVIPGLPDYRWPGAAGSRPEGRYLTAAPFDGAQLGARRGELQPAPHFPIGISYDEIAKWGGLSSRSSWPEGALAERRSTDRLTFGQAVAASFLSAADARGVELVADAKVVDLLADKSGRVRGVSVAIGGKRIEREGPVVLATGAHDWSPRRFSRLPTDDAGSLAPHALSGDAMELAEAVGGTVVAIDPRASALIPGCRLPEPAYSGDLRYRGCFEQSLPHSFLVNRSGQRFCDDAFHADVPAGVLREDDGYLPNLPVFMIWDEQHHRRYGLGATLPGGPYPAGLVAEERTLSELAVSLGVDPEGLEATAAAFNGPALGARIRCLVVARLRSPGPSEATLPTRSTPTSPRSQSLPSLGCGCDSWQRASQRLAYGPDSPAGCSGRTGSRLMASTRSARAQHGSPLARRITAAGRSGGR